LGEAAAAALGGAVRHFGESSAVIAGSLHDAYRRRPSCVLDRDEPDHARWVEQ